VVPDAVGDAIIRRTDRNEDGDIDPFRHRLIDLIDTTLGTWAPRNPRQDLFAGEFRNGAGFARIDLKLKGLCNPPGNVFERDFNPFAFGDNPVLGYIEIDVDGNTSTGGELKQPQFRYLGNVARFGGMPAVPRFRDRVARSQDDFRKGFDVPPFTKRHGEEFHIALFGEHFSLDNIIKIAGNDNDVFEQGETWRIWARLFHRAHGYEPFSLASGCGRSGEYDPISVIQFHHDMDADVTVVTLVFPLTNEAAARITGEETEPMDGNACNQASILEALADLHDSALFLQDHPTGLPEEAIITQWKDQNPRQFLRPTRWKFTAVLASSYTHPVSDGLSLLLTDVFPNVVRGDVNGDGVVNSIDQDQVRNWLRQNGRDGIFIIDAFARAFHLFDVNYSGTVDRLDVFNLPRQGDGDGDDDVDIADFAIFQDCFSGNGSPPEGLPCVLFDFDRNRSIDWRDYRGLIRRYRGPGTR